MKIALLSSGKGDLAAEAQALRNKLGDIAPADADVIVTMGGDGFLLRALHEHVHLNKPFYGLNRGTHGFLLNKFNPGDDVEKLTAAAKPVRVHPLRMVATSADGKTHEQIAFNEVALTRTGVQAAKLRISVDGALRMECLVGDGALVSTPMGSTGSPMARQAANRAQMEKAEFLRAYQTAYGHLHGADYAWMQYANDNPIFSREKQGEINDKRTDWRTYFSKQRSGGSSVQSSRGRGCACT